MESTVLLFNGIHLKGIDHVIGDLLNWRCQEEVLLLAFFSSFLTKMSGEVGKEAGAELGACASPWRMFLCSSRWGGCWRGIAHLWEEGRENVALRSSDYPLKHKNVSHTSHKGWSWGSFTGTAGSLGQAGDPGHETKLESL